MDEAMNEATDAQRHLTRNTRFSQSNTQTTQRTCRHQHHSSYSRRGPQILPSPDVVRHRSALHRALYQVLTLWPGEQPLLGAVLTAAMALGPHSSACICTLQGGLHQTSLHNVSCCSDCRDKSLCFLETPVTRRVSLIKTPLGVTCSCFLYCSPA